MCHFTKKNKEKILFKFECKKYRRQQNFLENGKSRGFENLIEQDRMITDDKKLQ